MSESLDPATHSEMMRVTGGVGAAGLLGAGVEVAVCAVAAIELSGTASPAAVARDDAARNLRRDIEASLVGLDNDSSICWVPRRI